MCEEIRGVGCQTSPAIRAARVTAVEQAVSLVEAGDLAENSGSREPE